MGIRFLSLWDLKLILLFVYITGYRISQQVWKMNKFYSCLAAKLFEIETFLTD